jgi:hypothetical protein
VSFEEDRKPFIFCFLTGEIQSFKKIKSGDKKRAAILSHLLKQKPVAFINSSLNCFLIQEKIV